MNMKVSKRDISILLFVLGAIAAFCVYQFYFRNALNQKKTYEEENQSLQTRLDKLNNIDENAVIADMAAKANELSVRAEAYPAAYQYEDIIMYLNAWQVLPYDEMYNFKSYAIEESAPVDVVGGVIDWDQTNRTPISANYVFSKAMVTANYGTNSYKAFKDMINKIYLDPLPKTISAVSATMDGATGFISGQISIDFFNVQNGSNVYTPVEIKDVDSGVTNIFGPTYTPTPTPTPTPAPNRGREED